ILELYYFPPGTTSFPEIDPTGKKWEQQISAPAPSSTVAFDKSSCRVLAQSVPPKTLVLYNGAGSRSEFMGNTACGWGGKNAECGPWYYSSSAYQSAKIPSQCIGKYCGYYLEETNMDNNEVKYSRLAYLRISADGTVKTQSGATFTKDPSSSKSFDNNLELIKGDKADVYTMHVCGFGGSACGVDPDTVCFHAPAYPRAESAPGNRKGTMTKLYYCPNVNMPTSESLAKNSAKLVAASSSKRTTVAWPSECIGRECSFYVEITSNNEKNLNQKAYSYIMDITLYSDGKAVNMFGQTYYESKKDKIAEARQLKKKESRIARLRESRGQSPYISLGVNLYNNYPSDNCGAGNTNVCMTGGNNAKLYYFPPGSQIPDTDPLGNPWILPSDAPY
ncbi:MAG: hypothetical protein KJ601_02640, partial [Nanoarchaeota archaeon]|nr:hypothetical protein [Nanoarchaeota archaeon]